MKSFHTKLFMILAIVLAVVAVILVFTNRASLRAAEAECSTVNGVWSPGNHFCYVNASALDLPEVQDALANGQVSLPENQTPEQGSPVVGMIEDNGESLVFMPCKLDKSFTVAADSLAYDALRLKFDDAVSSEAASVYAEVVAYSESRALGEVDDIYNYEVIYYVTDVELVDAARSCV